MEYESGLLRKLREEGYVYITTIASGLHLYKSNINKVFYDPKHDRITTPTPITKRPWEVYDSSQKEKRRKK